MRKHWIRFVSFWAVFAILFSLLNLAMVKGIDRWGFFYHLPKDSVSVVFIGNSHNFTAFQPKIIDSIIPVDSYVLGIDAENVIISYYELKEVLRTQHPDVVVLETYTLDVDDSQKMGYIFEFIDAGLWSKNKLAVVARYLSISEYYSIFPALRSRIDWNDLGSYTSKLIEQIRFRFSSTISEKRGAQIRTHAIVDSGETEVLVDENKEFRDPSQDIEIYLNKMYQLCQQNDIQLVLATAPVLKERIVEPEFYASYDESAFVQENDIPVITFAENQFNLLHYYNATHVNMMGSTIVSIETAKTLAQIMDLPVDQEVLGYYETFVFTGYTMANEKGHYYFDLVPSDEDALLEYQWKLFSDETGRTLIQSEWSTDSSAEFDVDEDTGLIYLVFEIRNPAGEETIGVSFPINHEDDN